MQAERIRRLAAPAPDREPPPKSDREPPPKSDRLEAEVLNTCLAWVSWSRNRRLFGAPARVGSIMEAWIRTPGRSINERDARCDQQLATFQAAINEYGNHPQRRMFEVHFLKPNGVHVKQVCEQFGIPRRTWYRHVNDFARTVYRKAFATTY